jgi:hypothetical protein
VEGHEFVHAKHETMFFCDGSECITNNIVKRNPFATMGAMKKVGPNYILGLATNALNQLKN